MTVFDGHTKMCKETVLCFSQQYQYYGHLGCDTMWPISGHDYQGTHYCICSAEHKDSRFLWITVGTKSHDITAQKPVMLNELNFIYDFHIETDVTN